MVDEVKLPNEGTEIVNTQAVEGDPSKAPVKTEELPQYTDTEIRALEQGWRPEEEWDGDPSEWRSAREFLDRGDLLSKIKSQSQELRDIKNQVQHLSDYNKKVYQAGYENALKQLKAQRTQALKDGDVDALVVLEEKIDQTKDAITEIKRAPVQQTQAPAISPNYTAWLNKGNKWYEQNPAMKHYADGLSMEFARVNAAQGKEVTEEALYEYLHKQVREDFPQKFPARVVAPSPDGQGRATQGGSKSTNRNTGDAFEKLMAEFPEDQARAARQLVSGGHVTKEKYVEDFNMVREK